MQAIKVESDILMKVVETIDLHIVRLEAKVRDQEADIKALQGKLSQVGKVSKALDQREVLLDKELIIKDMHTILSRIRHGNASWNDTYDAVEDYINIDVEKAVR
jgi:hypothetical protein